MGQIELVGKEQAARDGRACQQDRNHHAINADTCGLECDDFVGALHQSESDQHREQNSVLRDVVKEVGCNVQQIFPNNPE